MPDPPSSPPPPDDLLTGWKEIAAYLGKSVRSVQRWEREMGLPTHRIRTGDGGSIVSARRHEIDQWRAQKEAESAVVAAQEPDAPADRTWAEDRNGAQDVGSSAGPPPTGHDARRLRWNWPWLLTAGSLAVIAATSASFLSKMLASPPAPARVDVIRTAIRGLDADGRELWSYPLEAHMKSMHPGVSALRPERPMTTHVYRADLNNDGLTETVVPVAFGIPGLPAAVTDHVYAVSDGSRLLWHVAEVPPVRCGSDIYHGPWTLQAVLVSKEPGPRKVWLAYTHHTWWPSIILEVSPNGESAVRYFQAGWIMSLAMWVTPDRTLIAAGGVMNEQARASVVLLDPNGQPASTPHTGGAYDCLDAPPAIPHRMLQFPPLDVPRALNAPYVMVNRLSQVGPDLKIEISDSTLLAFLTPDNRLREIAFSDKFWAEHRRLESSHLLDHPAESCPLQVEPMAVNYWTPDTGWSSLLVPVTARARPLPR